jgi:hypothetical protein
MLRSVLALTLLILSVGGASAQDAPSRVGRLSYTEGTVSFHLGDQTDWAPATVNYPVTTGESFWTEPSARAEIQVGPTELRLDQTSELDVVRLDDTTIELQLDQGTLNLHLWQMPQGGISVLTPRGRVVLTALGSYDIDAGQPSGDVPSDRVQVTVLEGAARFEGERGAVEIGHSEAAIISGEPMNVALVAAANNPFDDWALARERREVAAQQPGYVAPTVTGYQDLNEYGSWSHDPAYGGVWYPTDVPAGWAPYRYGHWAFVPPWGWTWIDDAPWGFTPFHYGRWVETRDRWGWVPGALVARPVYAPALVAFIGGDGWGINLAAGAAVAAVGWVALAPNEVYHPYYRASQTYIRNVNVTNVNSTVINNITINNNNGHDRVSNFRNQQAATVVPAAAFTRAAPVQRATVAVPQAQLAQASVAPSITHLRPDEAARTGRAVPAAAAASVPQANAPATIAPTRVAAAPPPALAAEPAQTAPGPPRKSGERPNVPSLPAAAAPNAPSHPAPPSEAAQRAPAPAAAPNATLPPHPAPPNEAVQRAPSPTAAATPPLPPHPAPPSEAVQRAPSPTAAPNAQLPPHPVPPSEAVQRAPSQAVPPTAHEPPHPAPPSEAVRREPSPVTAPTAPAPQVALAPSRISAPTPPQTAAVPRPLPPVQPVRPSLPPIQVAHPEQQTHIAPTPQAWTRVPGPPPPPAPIQPAHSAAGAPHPAQPSQPAHAAPAKAPAAKDDHQEQH